MDKIPDNKLSPEQNVIENGPYTAFFLLAIIVCGGLATNSMFWLRAALLAATGLGLLMLVAFKHSHNTLVRGFEDRATLDAMTGTLNEEGFLQAAGELLEADKPDELVVALFDIENFHSYNESYGMAAGDDLLCSISLFFGDHDDVLLCGRLTSDHFVFIVPHREGALEGIDRELREHMAILEGREALDSIGFAYGAFVAGDDAPDMRDILARCSLALQTAKNGTGAKAVFYDGRMEKIAVREEHMHGVIKQALDKGEFEVYWQPIICLASGEWHCVEMLLRWNSPSLGEVTPSRFIPLAENAGFICDLDFYMLARVAQTYKGFLAMGSNIPPAAVNQARGTLLHPGYLRGMGKLLAQFPFMPEYIHLEIAESVFMQDAERLSAVVKTLRAWGFSISVDNFGREYSCLNLLQKTELDSIKLDGAFLQSGCKSSAAQLVLRGVVETATSMGIGVICEGVETKDQEDLIRDLGSSFVQGLLYGRPAPLREYSLHAYAH